MTLDVRRVARGAVLGSWAAFLGFLWVSGESARYLGPRTYWVVPFGAAVLGAAAVAHLATARTRAARGRIALGEVAGMVALVAPLLAVAVAPGAELGALAASRKSSGAGVAAATLVPPDPGGDVSFAEVYYASESSDYAAQVGIRDGFQLELTGFVSGADGAPEDGFSLSRFYVSCCAADAIPYSVPVAAPRAYPVDAWVRVSGALEHRDGRWVLVADSVARVPEPDRPYLY
ncbi:MAG TPA: hypothetical protein VHJ34_04330 [Actinomycetota bacterium]|nr:hypothetical protein [Actinomycetota bacterium]